MAGTLNGSLPVSAERGNEPERRHRSRVTAATVCAGVNITIAPEMMSSSKAAPQKGESKNTKILAMDSINSQAATLAVWRQTKGDRDDACFLTGTSCLHSFITSKEPTRKREPRDTADRLREHRDRSSGDTLVLERRSQEGGKTGRQNVRLS